MTELEKLRNEVRELNQIVGAFVLGTVVFCGFPEPVAKSALKDLAVNDKRISEIGA